MEFKFYGANCIKITTKKANIVIDDNLASLGKKSITTDKDITLATNKEFSYSDDGRFVIKTPGEYELSEVSIKGIPTKLHYDPNKPSVMYSVHINGLSIAIMGHAVGELTEKQVEEFGVIDVLIIPVGGSGFTLDTVEAVKIVKELEPKIVIPTHYDSKDIKYEVPQADVNEFLKSSAASDVETIDSLKIKDNNLPEKTRVVLVNEQ